MPSSSHSLTQRVVQAVATYADTDPLELPPLYDTIDPEALEAGIDEMSDGEIQFRYAGHSVTVRSDGIVDVTDDATSRSRQAEPATDD